MKEFRMTGIPREKKDDKWKVRIDGQLADISLIEISSPHGELAYGLRPEGFIGWAWKEIGGGGSVTLFHSFIAGETFIGLLEENRLNMGDRPVLCIAGGFVDVGEDHWEAQKREACEKTGISTKKAIELPGLPVISNRLYFVADPHCNEGVHLYALEVPSFVLEKSTCSLGDCWRPKKEVPGFGKSNKLVFLSAKDAVNNTADVFAHSAIARLILNRE